MRKGIDYIGVTVCFYCHDGKGNFLLQKRSQNCRDEQGKWDCGGGSMKVGETFIQSVKRELLEEYCIKPGDKDILFCGVNNVLREHGNQKTHWVALIFSVKVVPEKIKIGDSDKIAGIGWFTLHKLPSPLHSMYKTHLDYVLKGGHFR